MAEIAKSVLTLTADGSGLTAASKRAENDMRRIGKAGKDLNTNMRIMRGGFGQIGHQIQDVAVQLQGGTDAMIVFGQQGSQIASLFGPGGAMLGAILAISAGIAGPLIDALTGASGALRDLEENANASIPSLEGMIALERKLAEESLRTRLASLEEARTEAIRLQAEAQETLNEKENGRFKDLRANQDAADRAREQVEEYQKQIDTATVAIQKHTLALDPAAQAQLKYEEQLGKTNESLQEQIDTFGMNIVEIAEYKAMQDGVKTALEKTNIALTEQLFLLQEQARAKKKAAKEDAKTLQSEQAMQRFFNDQVMKDLEKSQKQKAKQRTDEQDAMRMFNKMAMKDLEDRQKAQAKKRADDKKAKDEAIKGVSEQLMSLDSSNKKVFQMQKGYRMAEATMAAYQAATNALAAPFPFPIPQAMAAAALSFGLANVANIKAQSFEGGGFTGRGARAGGLDGKGGRMAMVHPNETIIDHTKGQGAGITIVNNVDASGAGADVDQKIQVAMQRTSQATVLQIQDLMRRKRFA
jgi:hypothetical protein